MSYKFDPNDLVNNLNNNFDSIIGNAIIGYYEFYKMEQLLLKNITFFKSSVTEQSDGNKKKIMAFLIAYANCILDGKSYFLGEIIQNYRQMKNLTNYINFSSPFFSAAPSQYSKGTAEEVGEQSAGSPPHQIIFTFIIAVLLSSLTNATAIANTIAPSGRMVSVSIPINIDKGQMPKAISGVKGTLNPLNETQMNTMTGEFGYNVEFPKDTIVVSKNISEIYGPNFVKNLKKTQNLWGKISSLIYDDEFDSKFISAIISNLDDINRMIDVTHTSLDNMCKEFVETSDVLLPIPLYKILNSKVAARMDEFKEKRDNIKNKKETELTGKKMAELHITEPEPGVTQQVKNTISSMFSWPKTSVSETSVSTTITSSELSNIYQDIDDSVSKEIEELGNSFDTQAFNEITQEILTELDQQTTESLQVTNLKIYLSAICKITKPQYVFNQTSGEIYIQNPSSSRNHLMVLAKNVVSYYDIIKKGLQSIGENGENIVDIPDDVRITNLKSLLEKANAIIPILVQYDTGIVQSLSGQPDTAETMPHFFEDMANFWTGIAEPMNQAARQFPITEQTTERRLRSAEEEAERNAKESIRLNAIDERERMLVLAQKKANTELTSEEWEIFHKWLGTNVAGGLGVVDVATSALINTTTNMMTNTLDGAASVSNKGMVTIMSLAWGIATSGMILFIPIILFLTFKTGLISAVFSNIAKKIEPGIQQNSVPASAQSNALVTQPRVSRKTRWGPPLGGNRRKTRNHKKKRTNKLNGRKRRQTKYRKGRRTKKR